MSIENGRIKMKNPGVSKKNNESVVEVNGIEYTYNKERNLAISERTAKEGYFAKVNPDVFLKDPNYVSISHSDGIGSKGLFSHIHYDKYKEDRVWEYLVQDALAMNLNDLSCLGTIDNLIVGNTITYNYDILDKKIVDKIIGFFEKKIEWIKKCGINIEFAGGETANIYSFNLPIFIDCCISTRKKKEDLIKINIQKGDYIVGIASYGKSLWEQNYNFNNSGIGCNGFTFFSQKLSCREILLEYKKFFPLREELCLVSYDDYMDFLDTFIHPTRMYFPLLNHYIRDNKENINGIIHNTGGGHTKVLHFIREKGLKIKKKFTPNDSKVNKFFQELSIVTENKQILKTFYESWNIGYLMEVYTKDPDSLIKLSKKYEIDAKIIGRVE